MKFILYFSMVTYVYVQVIYSFSFKPLHFVQVWCKRLYHVMLIMSLLLDCSKAFNSVNYFKLFWTLLDRNVCPPYSTLLLNMYINQELRIRWEITDSSSFNVTNGAKQGGGGLFLQFCFVFTWMVC